jgi:hypothetical protein
MSARRASRHPRRSGIQKCALSRLVETGSKAAYGFTFAFHTSPTRRDAHSPTLRIARQHFDLPAVVSGKLWGHAS